MNIRVEYSTLERESRFCRIHVPIIGRNQNYINYVIWPQIWVISAEGVVYQLLY